MADEIEEAGKQLQREGYWDVDGQGELFGKTSSFEPRRGIVLGLYLAEGATPADVDRLCRGMGAMWKTKIHALDTSDGRLDIAAPLEVLMMGVEPELSDARKAACAPDCSCACHDE